MREKAAAPLPSEPCSAAAPVRFGCEEGAPYRAGLEESERQGHQHLSS